MMQQQIAPYGTWKSPITSDLIVAGSIGLGQISLDGEDLYWQESRPQEAGRTVLVRRLAPPSSEGSASSTITDVTPLPFNVRSRVHEYGGGAVHVVEGQIYFVNFTDQRLYVQNTQTPEAAPVPLTETGPFRYADLRLDAARQRLLAVREDHSQPEREPVNTIVSISLSTGAQTVLASGHDFYAAPRLSADGQWCSWLSWDHPQMPWDGTELWVARWEVTGALTAAQKIAGSTTESIFQPEWAADGTLYFVSDRSDWWNLYRWHPDTQKINCLCEKAAEFGLPLWVFGMSTYGFASADRLICTYTEAGISHLASLDLPTGQLTEIPTPYTSITGLQVSSGQVVFIGGSPTTASAIVRFDLATQQFNELRRASNLTLESGYLSIAQPFAFPTEQGLTAYALYYPPQNQDYQAPEADRPPLLVKSHGGPTSATGAELSLKIQYWTSRGFAVLDVNYGGSTGYGRAYRERLKGQWGVVDVQDCVNGAKALVAQDRVDGDRLVITGGSAGGYTTLCALTFHDTFKAGASHYGVSDLTALAEDTHKFESRYLDGLIGPYPAQRDLYLARSPIQAIGQLNCPVIFFQGDEDRIVPPNQAERMVQALRNQGLPVAYLLFPGEQHGFRKAENIQRALDGEFSFYAQVFGFTPADAIAPVPLDA